MLPITSVCDPWCEFCD